MASISSLADASFTPMPSETAPELKAKALWFTAPRTAELREETVPPPGPGEVRIETTASAVSAGTEMLVYRGEVPQDLPLDLPTLEGSYAFPIKYGYAAAGRVLDTGPDVEQLFPGDPVFVHHPHQEASWFPRGCPCVSPTASTPCSACSAPTWRRPWASSTTRPCTSVRRRWSWEEAS